MRPRTLDLFCGAGGASMGLHRAGFDVVGVDIAPQPHYPFEFVQADALTYPIDGFDMVWASPPCQTYSRLSGYATRNYAALVEPIRARLEAAGCPYIIENVQGAPLLNPITLCGTMFGLRVFRHRLFESNVYLFAPQHVRHEHTTGSHRWPYKPTGGFLQVTGNGGNYDIEDGKAAMGIDWMQSKRELSESIPPAYSEYLGRQIMQYLSTKVA